MGRFKYLALAALVAAVVVGGPSSVPVQGQGGVPPILILHNPGSLSSYLAEILRTEGVQSFEVRNIADITSTTLANYRLIVLAEVASLSGAQVTALNTYVSSGGRLIAMRPPSALHGTLGIASVAGTLANTGNTPLSITISQSGPGAGLYSQSLPFRGPVTQYNAPGSSTVATLNGSGGFPAVFRSGRTATWAFDLAKSVAYVRQGNPADKDQDRDGQPIYRTNDIFYNRLDKSRVNVPHADINMRLFVRVIDDLLADSLPLPRLWYFPGTNRTQMVITGDSHTSVGSHYTNLLATAESLGARVSLYLARYINIPQTTVTNWISRGHEVGLHPYFDPDGLAGNMPGGYNLAVDWWNSRFPGLAYSPTSRHHSLEWKGWADPAITMQNFSIRLDSSYYAWGPALNNPTQTNQAHGYINGSGQPMYFIQENGAVTPVYQLVTSLTDEQLITGSYAEGKTVEQATVVSRQLIDESQAGFYAAIVTQFHVDYYDYGEVGPWADNTMAYARSLQIPMWTGQRYLGFLDRRRATTVTNVAWSDVNRALTFTVQVPAVPSGEPGYTMLVPGTFGGDTVTSVVINGQAVTAPQFAVNGRTMRAITLTPSTSATTRNVTVLYAVGTPAISIGDLSVTEGHAGTVTRQVPVFLSTPSPNTVTASYQTVAGTATQGVDYQAASGTVTFPPFQTSASIPVGIIGDLLVEGNETFSVTLSNPNNATIEDNIGIVTITDDDAPPTITISDVTVTEGNSGTTPATFTVSLSHASGNTVTVQYTTANGTATAGSDYTAGSGTLTFNAGVTSLPITVPVLGDTAAEANETFVVNLSNAQNGVIGDPQGTGTITNDDSGTAITTATFPVLAGADDVNEEGTTLVADSATVWVGSGASAAASFAGFRFANVTIPPGAVVQSARLELRSASTQWLTTSFEFAMEASTNAPAFTATSRPSQRTLLAPRVSHTSDVQWLANTSYQLDDIGALVQAAVNQPGWAAGNALALIVRGAGQNWARKFATAFEGGAAFAPRLVVTYASAQGDPEPSLSINDITVAEGNSGTTPAVFTVSLSAATGQPVTVNWATANGTATVATNDYVAGSGVLTFPAGSTAPQTITVQVNGDTVAEPNETFVVNLSSPSNATIADATGQATITNDDAVPVLSINNVTVTEGNSGVVPATFTVTLTPASGQTVTVNWAANSNTATTGQDFTAASGVLTFAPGDTSETLTVNVLGDTIDEANETFTVALSNPSNASIAPGGGTGTITDDDPQPSVSIADVTVAEGNSGTAPATFTVTLSQASGLPVTVTYQTSNGSATAGSDYTAASGQVTIPAGSTSATFGVPIIGDTTVEPNETFTVTLSAPQNATLGDATATGTINNDDGATVLSINDVTVVEGDGGTVNAVFTVSLSAPTAQTVTVTASTANGTATAPDDYTAVNTLVTFPPTTTTQQVVVPVVGDTLIEGTETFTVDLSNASVGIADGTGLGTITDNDAPALSINDVAAPEGNSGSSVMTFTVSLSTLSPQTVTVNYATANGTATAGSDYVAASGTLTFTPGTLTRTIAVTINGDTTTEGNETFVVNLTAPANANLADAQGVGTITNDDAGPVVVTTTFQVAAGADDVTEVANALAAGDATGWIGNANSATASFAGFRLTGVTIPAGATITSARLEVNSASTQWQRMAFEFGMEAATNSAPFTTTARPSQRVLLAPRVNHSSDTQWAANTWQPLEEIAPLLQAVVNQPGWTSGNAVTIVLRGTGDPWGRKFIRTFEGGAAFAPRLVVTYQINP